MALHGRPLKELLNAVTKNRRTIRAELYEGGASADYTLAGARSPADRDGRVLDRGAANKESSSGDFLTSLSGFEVPVDS